MRKSQYASFNKKPKWEPACPGLTTNGKPLKFKLIKCAMDQFQLQKGPQGPIRGFSIASPITNKQKHKRHQDDKQGSVPRIDRSLPPLKQDSKENGAAKKESYANKLEKELNYQLDGIRRTKSLRREPSAKQQSVPPLPAYHNSSTEQLNIHDQSTTHSRTLNNANSLPRNTHRLAGIHSFNLGNAKNNLIQQSEFAHTVYPRRQKQLKSVITQPDQLDNNKRASFSIISRDTKASPVNQSSKAALNVQKQNSSPQMIKKFSHMAPSPGGCVIQKNQITGPNGTVPVFHMAPTNHQFKTSAKKQHPQNVRSSLIGSSPYADAMSMRQIKQSQGPARRSILPQGSSERKPHQSHSMQVKQSSSLTSSKPFLKSRQFVPVRQGSKEALNQNIENLVGSAPRMQLLQQLDQPEAFSTFQKVSQTPLLKKSAKKSGLNLTNCQEQNSSELNIQQLDSLGVPVGNHMNTISQERPNNLHDKSGQMLKQFSLDSASQQKLRLATHDPAAFQQQFKIKQNSQRQPISSVGQHLTALSNQATVKIMGKQPQLRMPSSQCADSSESTMTDVYSGSHSIKQ